MFFVSDQLKSGQSFLYRFIGFIICAIDDPAVYPVHASSISCRYVLPQISGVSNVPVVSDFIAYSRAYLFIDAGGKDRRFDCGTMHVGHDVSVCTFVFKKLNASGYYFAKYCSVFSILWFMVLCVIVSFMTGATAWMA